MGGFRNLAAGFSQLGTEWGLGQQQLAQQKYQQQQLAMQQSQMALDKIRLQLAQQQQEEEQRKFDLQQQLWKQLGLTDGGQGNAPANPPANAPTATGPYPFYPRAGPGVIYPQGQVPAATSQPQATLLNPLQMAAAGFSPEVYKWYLQDQAAKGNPLAKQEILRQLTPEQRWQQNTEDAYLQAAGGDIVAANRAMEADRRASREPNEWDVLAQAEDRDQSGNYTPAALRAQSELKRRAELTAGAREPRAPSTEDIQLAPGAPFMRLREAPAGTKVGTPGTYTPKGTNEVWTVEGPTRAAPRTPASAAPISQQDVHFLNLVTAAGGPQFPSNKFGAARAKDWVESNMVSASKDDITNAGKALSQANKDIGEYGKAFAKESYPVHHWGWSESAATQKIHDQARASATQAAIAALNSGQEIPQEIRLYVDNSQTVAATKRYAEILKWRQIVQQGGVPPDISSNPSAADSDTDTDDNAQ